MVFFNNYIVLLPLIFIIVSYEQAAVFAHLEGTFYKLGAERFFSVLDIPAQCVINAMREREQQRLTAEQIEKLESVGKTFKRGKSKPLVKLSPEQMLWFVTQGTQNSRIVESKDKSKRSVLPNQDLNIIKQRSNPLPIRKELRMMTPKEWADFVQAVLSMRASFPEGGGSFDTDYPASEYDILVVFHNPKNSPSAHVGPAFSPWHREYLFRFETALRHHVPTAVLPYWDSSLDSSLPIARDSVIWTDEFLGNNDGPVTTGPFANFSVLGQNDPSCALIGENITRTDTMFQDFLYSQDKFRALFDLKTYGEFQSWHEVYHNGIHFNFAGHLYDIPCSPSDPLFYLHHCFVDALWEEFRQNHQLTDPEIDYPTENPPGHDPFDPMSPFEPKYNIEGLSNDYTNYRYKYAARPSKGFCTSDGACESVYLWCNTDTCRCTSKVREFGVCADLPDRVCYCSAGVGRCVNQICECGHD